MPSAVRETIITCAVTGAVHTPTMSEYLPLTPQQIAESAIEAAEAGAAILHIHARDPQGGRPSADPALFRLILPVIAGTRLAAANRALGGEPGNMRLPS